MHIISNIALITINETLFVQLISFLIFLFIINRIMFRPLQNTMSERESYIGQINRDIADATKELQSLTNKLQAKERETRDQAFELQSRIEELAKKDADAIHASVLEEIKENKQKVEKEVEILLYDARKNIGKESESLAGNIMECLLDRRLVQ
jgi:F-type H+-transporting ATPase subunit b